MKTQLLLPALGLFLAGFSFQSCGPRYGPAYLGSNNTYLAKPAYKGARVNTVCFGGRVNDGVVYYEGEKNNTYELSAHVSLMRRYFYYSGGLFGYWGKYRLDTMPGSGISLTPYSVRGFGVRHEIGGRLPLDEDFDLLLGVGLQTFNERGKFSELTRDEADVLLSGIFLLPFIGPDALDADAKSGGAGFDINMNIRYAPPARDYMAGFRYSYGFSQGEGFADFLYLHQLTLHGSYRRFTVYGQLGFGSYQENLFNIRGNPFHAGLTYAIPFGKKRTPPPVDN